jgi:hypothetical protein
MLKWGEGGGNLESNLVHGGTQYIEGFLLESLQ